MNNSLALCLLLCASVATAAPADLILVNANIHTVDAGKPRARALAVQAGRIQFVGSEPEARALAGRDTQIIDLDGATVLPGLIDAHAHLQSFGESLLTVDLRGTTRYAEVIARVRQRAAQVPAGRWIIGRGWDQNDWGETALPDHAELSAATPNHPVYLERVDGHAVLINQQALVAAAIDDHTPAPEGGRIERNARGEASGVLVDNAMGLVYRVLPAADPDAVRDAVRAGVAELNRYGLTGIHDAGVPRSTIERFEELAQAGQFNLRNYVMIDGHDAKTLDYYLARGAQNGIHGHRLWIRSIKLVGDGALGSRGAWLLEPYADAPGQRGLSTLPPERVREVAERALDRGFQLAVHAIGDQANRSALDAIATALSNQPRADHRFRIEHAQILNPQDLLRFSALGVIPSMQASHQTSDMYWAGQRIGPTRELGAYAWRSLIDSGAIIPNGSDLPVELPDPLISYVAAFTRQDANGFPAGGWHAEQRMSRDEALKSMTLWPAQAAFMEQSVGSLSAGKLADWVVFDIDITSAEPAAVRRAKVLSTWIGGAPVYQRHAAR